MSAAAQTKIFGMRLGIDPKILIGALIAIAAALFWYNSRGDDQTSGTAAVVRRETASGPIVARPRAATVRRSGNSADRGTLRLRPVDATRGDVDPTLRLDLLARLRSVPAAEGGRNLFELGPAPPTAAELAKRAPIITPKPLPAQPGPPPAALAPVFNIPLKYYGFVKDSDPGTSNRGLFLDGDNVLVASEGEVLMQRYMVVQLTATGARLEDVQAKHGETLPVVPVAMP